MYYSLIFTKITSSQRSVFLNSHQSEDEAPTFDVTARYLPHR